MARYAPRMTQDDLRRILVDLAVRNDYVEDYGPVDPARPDLTRILSMLLGEDLLPQVEKDWSKIDFSTENMDVTAERTTSDGVPYLLIRAGGDWETPLACIVYFDGRKVRGYVPKDGNSYNHRTKAAFGNHDGDAPACAEQFGARFDHEEGFREVDPDMALVEKDIDARIEAKGDHAHVPATIVSKAARKAAEQARIEAKQDLTGPITADMVFAVVSLAAGGAYVQFELRSSRRKLRVAEGERLVGVPSILEKTILSEGEDILWYSPQGCYPAQTLAILKDAGFAQAPDNDISAYQGARTVVISRR